MLSATTGSRPDVGSSYNTQEGRRIMERARPTRFFIPPLRLSGILFSDCFRQCPHRDHWRRPARNQRRLNGGLGRWRRFDHRNEPILNSRLSTFNFITPTLHPAITPLIDTPPDK